MKINVEKKSLSGKKPYSALAPYYEALRDMKVGESFLVNDAKKVANMRMVLSACKTLIGSHFAVRKEGDKYRIGRTK